MTAPAGQLNFADRVGELLAQYDQPAASIAQLLVDRHPADAVAFHIVHPDLSATKITFGELATKSHAFASALAAQGVKRGDAVGVLMGKSEELVVALIGIWRLGAIHVPLFTAFAAPAIELRLSASRARVVVVDDDQQSKLDVVQIEGVARIVVGGAGSDATSYNALMDAHNGQSVDTVAGGGAATMILLFTSGTTGTPKGVLVPARAIASLHEYMEMGLDLRNDDVFWNAADPGWAYGLYYALVGPMAMGLPSILLKAGFSPALSWQVMERFGVTNFAAAPTVYRALRTDPAPIPEGLRLRRASSAGEPLTPDVINWAQDALGTTVRDHYGQTEHGMMICNSWIDGLRAEVKPGSMGRPLPGWAATVLADDRDEPAEPGTAGRVAIDTTASPMMWFSGYLDAPEKTAERYSPDGRWYLTGDAGTRDADGHFFFSSRDDDVIIMGGYRIGPFEVESVLAMHEAVAESAVIGAPDELRGEVLEAYVVLAHGREGDAELTAELQNLVKQNFAAHAYPRSVHYVSELPKTPSGKVQRFILRKQAR